MKNVVRVKKNSNFVVMDKTALNDKSLTWKAKGIMAFMLSKPDDWVFYLDEIAKNSADGMASFRSGFNELKKAGYVKRVQKRDENGKFIWETIVYEIPLTDFPQVENPHVENPHMENRNLLNNDLTKNDLTKNDSSIYSIFEHWNDQSIIQHKRMNQKMKSHTNARLEDYSEEELKKAIDNYKTVLSGTEYYWTHKWTYEEFMKPNNVVRFLDQAEPFNNFRKGDNNDFHGPGGGNAKRSGKGTSYEQAKRELEAASRALGR
ncbi:DNA-binding protein [Oceanobacillus picturae]|uniref:DNA-binding protein, partial n=1 Tax=Oceanobacillus picturae TaxID=171693 RepID=A0A0U9H7Q7_9BACI|nr:hypothetical protein [Oceanobacillus picturae]GAQ18000.1 DNA-binding protein [Oceanobacillus picturae]